jgi:putative transposase
LHVLTTRLAKTHGRVVVEGLDAAGMLRQKGLPGARARRRGLSDAALGTLRRHLSYKAGWYGSQLVVADRWFPSSKTCLLTGLPDDTPADLHRLSAAAGSSRWHGVA